MAQFSLSALNCLLAMMEFKGAVKQVVALKGIPILLRYACQCGLAWPLMWPDSGRGAEGGHDSAEIDMSVSISDCVEIFLGAPG